ncbi:MAG TPA: UDP-N-acetylmuramoyl-L-alanyl-D-glutamate--2,6-diaminopimelate ligase [Solirubrobacteraceae bacterium]|jgi:UDP-N-acetylmuramoyl-L-alanyl-D-glutamate--2,6-diaminopimelate ligase|nr:UDP-N-acetylmuramoyl-L-alanyl-D-glutamate--2,6-diaminopimelate ligase [Solirubrobacteraceae bacterium]
MRLGALVPADPAAADVEIGSLAYDSRRVCAGALFFCVSGLLRDGHEFAPQAVERGAAALVVERRLALEVPQVLVADARAAMAPAAAAFHGYPTRTLRVVGITGTNGKTTTAFLTRAILERAGIASGLLGTVRAVVGGVAREVSRTTAEAIDLQADFAAMLAGGDRACVMEVSSHALELGRADAIELAAGVFTHLSQDHLDFHPDMEAYFQAKRRLFFGRPGAGPPAASVLGIDDPYARRLAQEIPAALTFALGREADFQASEIRSDLAGAHFHLKAPTGGREIQLPLPGRFNVANALAAAGAAHALGVELDVIGAALAEPPLVPGRFEPVDEGQDFAVLIDYAHTPDALENVVRAASEITRARVICVFGAGGDRDRTKRPLMGRAAAEGADLVIVTSDNPRSEDPEAIIGEIMVGVREAGRSAQVIVDRREAIFAAVQAARPGDVVLIAGKGHEQGQELAGGEKIPFDDVSVARDALRERHPLRSPAR